MELRPAKRSRPDYRGHVEETGHIMLLPALLDPAALGWRRLRADEDQHLNPVFLEQPEEEGASRVLKEVVTGAGDSQAFFAEVHFFAVASAAGLAPKILGYAWDDVRGVGQILSSYHGPSLRRLVAAKEITRGEATRVVRKIQIQLILNGFDNIDDKFSNILVQRDPLTGKIIPESAVMCDWGTCK